MKFTFKMFVLLLLFFTFFYPMFSLAQCSLQISDCTSMSCTGFDPDLCECISCSSSGSSSSSSSGSSSAGCSLTSADCSNLNCASFDPGLCKCVNCALDCTPPKVSNKYKVTLSDISGSLTLTKNEVYRLKIIQKGIRTINNTLLKDSDLTQYNNEQHLAKVRHLEDKLSSTDISTRRFSQVTTFTSRCSDKDTDEAIFDLPFDFTFADLVLFANWQCVGTFINEDIIGTCTIDSFSIEGSTQEINLSGGFVAKPQ